MSCKNRENGCCSVDIGRGCHFCNCSSESEATAMESSYKLHATDWLEGYPTQQNEDIVEVRFKNTRRCFFRNANGLALKAGDIVAVEASPGHDIGIVASTGDMVTRQMRRTGFTPLNGEYRKLYRLAKPYDIEKWQEAIALEHETMIRARQIAADLRLNMKIGDVEFQGDKIKAIFYYIAEERVDFRELIKLFAEEFRIKIEMKQIGARQEAGRIGGIGSCGRELCCGSWISSFVSVTTNAARTQEISLNPQKLAGQCSKLKCCLSYEFDTYMDARKDFPRVREALQAIDGEYFLVKSDILARTMTFSTTPHAMVGLVILPLKRVREILEINRRGEKVDKLLSAEYIVPKEIEPSFINAIGEDSLTRFDKKREGGSSSGGGNRGRGGRGRNERGERPQQSAQGEGRGAGEGNNENRGGGESRGGEARNNNRPNRNNNERRGDNQQRRAKPEGEQGTSSNRGGEQSAQNQRNTRNADQQSGGQRNGHNSDSQQGEPRNSQGANQQGASERNPQGSESQAGGANRNRNRNRRRGPSGGGAQGEGRTQGEGSQGGNTQGSGENKGDK